MILANMDTEREAMWMNFFSKERFAVKVFVGGVNVVSGATYDESEGMKIRRSKLYSEGESVQDYIVTPQQLWLDGIASDDGTVRQFVAMPLDSGYTVEAQITGADIVGGLQIEVTPVKKQYAWSLPHLKSSGPKPAGTPHIEIAFRNGTKETRVRVSTLTRIDRISSFLAAMWKRPQEDFRLVFEGCRLRDGDTPRDHGMRDGDQVEVHDEQYGGGPGPEMGIAAGGRVKQTIRKDDNDPTIWDPDNGTVFEVQILNSAVFEAVTGKAPPETPITAKTYASYGFPYYDIYEEKSSGIKGNFSAIRSVAEKDLEGVPTLEKAKGVAEVIEDTDNSVVFLDKTGEHSGICSVKPLEKKFSRKAKKPKLT